MSFNSFQDKLDFHVKLTVIVFSHLTLAVETDSQLPRLCLAPPAVHDVILQPPEEVGPGGVSAEETAGRVGSK